MFGFKLKTTNRETEEIIAIETYVVQWTRRYGAYSTDTVQAFQSFLSKEDAEKFAASLRQANKLIGNTSETSVSVYKQKSGL